MEVAHRKLFEVHNSFAYNVIFNPIARYAAYLRIHPRLGLRQPNWYAMYDLYFRIQERVASFDWQFKSVGMLC
jgi:hypothetical protein